MSEELQHLMERIKTEAIDEAEARAREIVTEAEQQAADLVRKAQEEANRHREAAEQEAAGFQARSLRSIEQASRDLLITLKQDITRLVESMVRSSVQESFKGPGLQELLGKAIEAYVASGGSADDLQVLLGREEREQLAAWFKSEYAQLLKSGATLDGDDAVLRGFRLSGGDGGFFEITDETLTDALGRFLRPHLLEAVKKAADETAD